MGCPNPDYLRKSISCSPKIWFAGDTLAMFSMYRGKEWGQARDPGSLFLD
jgi:hypothetical protein